MRPTQLAAARAAQLRAEQRQERLAPRATGLCLRHQPLSKAQVRDAQRILNDAIDGLVDIDAFGAADLLVDLRNLLTR